MIAVVGGTGTVGSRVVERLAESGQPVMVLSRHEPDRPAPGISHQVFDLSADHPFTLPAGTEVLIDLANSSTRPDKVLLDGTSRLLDACARSAVAHYVGISIVGCEQVGLGYYKAKTRQEKLIRNSPVPWSLIQATQFHELIDGLMTTSARFGILPAGKMKLQPVASSEVGTRLCRVALAEPLNGTDRLVGPEVSTLGELAKAWMSATGRKRIAAPLPLPGRTGRALREGVLTDPAARSAGPTFSEWLSG